MRPSDPKLTHCQGIEKLKFKPDVMSDVVGEDAEKYFAEKKLIPSFTFVDPFEYGTLAEDRQWCD